METVLYVIANLLYIAAGFVLGTIPWKKARRELFYRFNPEYRPDMVLSQGDIEVFFYRFVGDGSRPLVATVTEGNRDFLSRWCKDLPGLDVGDQLMFENGEWNSLSAKSFTELYTRDYKEQ